MRCPNLHELPPPPVGVTGWPWTVESPQQAEATADGKAWPKMSIVTPSYNQGQFIEATIRSVLLQGYPELEYIIIDGGSTDDTIAIIRKYEKWLFHWVSEPDRGQGHAINKGFARSSGRVLGWMNSDDYFMPGALTAVAKASQRSPCAGGWIGECQLVFPRGKVFVRHPRDVSASGLANWLDNWIMQPATLFSRDAWLTCGPIDEGLRFALDLDLWLKIGQKYSFQTVEELLATALMHEQAKTQTGGLEIPAEAWLVLLQHGYKSEALANMAAWVSRMTGTTSARHRRPFPALARSPLLKPIKLLRQRLYEAIQ